MLKKIVIKDDVFEQAVTVYLGTGKEFEAELKQLTSEDVFEEMKEHIYTSHGLALCVPVNQKILKDKPFVNIIWLSKPELKLLLHEFSHMVLLMCEQKSLKVSASVSESYAYLFAYYASQAIKLLKITK